MHFHSPLSKKSEKRKASTTSTVSEDAPVEKTPSIKLVKQPKNKNKKMKRKARTATPEDPHPQSPSPTLSRSASQDLAASSPADTILQQTSPTQTAQPESNTTTTPRRSARIKNSMSGISNTWHKARPYIERINGTIMPLEHQSAQAYYGRDGVKM